MWLMTRYGFYSIVQKDDGIHIRSREREDLERLVTALIPVGVVQGVQPDGKVIVIIQRTITPPPILTTPGNDYQFRIIVTKEYLERVMAWLTRTCDYPNFKAQIDSDHAQHRKPYHQVWDVMARSLGAYGRKGDAR